MAEPTLAMPVYRPRRAFGTLTGRAVLVTTLAALISVLVTALVAFPVAIRRTNDEARAGLADKANLVAIVLSTKVGATTQDRLVRQLRQKKVDIWLIDGGQVDRAGLPPTVVSSV